MAVVALVASGVGGVIGGFIGADSTVQRTGGTGLDNNTVPSDMPSRPPGTVAGVAQRASPSVVSIQAAGSEVTGNGSGFVIRDNYVVTNNHVADALQGRGIEVVYSDGRVSQASIVGSAPSSDLAVLSLADPIAVEPLRFGDSDAATVGDSVIAIGAPLGLDGTVTTGIISAVDRPVTVGQSGEETYFNAIQTDAAINPGNSGGPLVNIQGEVIGVNSAIATMGGGISSEQSGSIGLGFAIPATQAKRVVDQLIATGEAPHAVIGAILDTRYQDTGALIVAEEDAESDPVLPGGPADQAGLQPGDVIVEFDGETVHDANQLVSLIQEKSPGDQVEVVFERDGQRRSATLTLGSSDE
ncbi:S1C family serine protease [Salinactinospora qingdaonensis]